MFVANKINSIKDDDESIKKCGKLSKTGKLFKSKNSKSEILSKFKKHLMLVHVFILLKIVFIDI